MKNRIVENMGKGPITLRDPGVDGKAGEVYRVADLEMASHIGSGKRSTVEVPADAWGRIAKLPTVQAMLTQPDPATKRPRLTVR